MEQMFDDVTNDPNFDCYQMIPGQCPEEGQSPFGDAVQAAYRSLVSLNNEAQKVRAEPYLTTEGKRKRLEPLQKRAVDAIAEQARKVALHEAQLGPAEDRLFSPPSIDPGNAVEAHDDAERRRWFDGLGDRERTAVEEELRAGKHEDILKALARSPVPGRLRAIGLQLWREQLEKKRALEVQALVNRRRAVEWARATLQSIARYAETDPWSTSPAESAVEKMTRGRLGRRPAPQSSRAA